MNLLKQTTRTFLLEKIDSYENLIGIDLTMKHYAGGFRLDGIRSSRNFRHFTNLLNKQIYGSAFTRFGRRLPVIASLEHASRYHYHTVFQVPDKMCYEHFCAATQSAWQKTHFGYRETYYHPSIDAGWINYITKFKSKEFDLIDWDNVCLDF